MDLACLKYDVHKHHAWRGTYPRTLCVGAAGIFTIAAGDLAMKVTNAWKWHMLLDVSCDETETGFTIRLQPPFCGVDIPHALSAFLTLRFSASSAQERAQAVAAMRQGLSAAGNQHLALSEDMAADTPAATTAPCTPAGS